MLWAFFYSSLSWRIPTILQVTATEALEVECHCHTATSSHVCWWPGRRFPKSEILAQSPPQDSSLESRQTCLISPKAEWPFGHWAGPCRESRKPSAGPRIASPAWLNLAAL